MIFIGNKIGLVFIFLMFLVISINALIEVRNLPKYVLYRSIILDKSFVLNNNANDSPDISAGRRVMYNEIDDGTLDGNLRYFREYAKRGMNRMKIGNLTGAILDFDRAVQADSSQIFVQRGILLYLLGNYTEAGKQIDIDIQKIEKYKGNKASDLRLWRAACLNKLQLQNEAKQAIVAYLPSEDLYEPRYWMNNTLKYYEHKIELTDILEMIESTSDKRDVAGMNFYTNFYLGLFHDSIDDMETCQLFLRVASESNRYPVQDMWYHVPRILYNQRFTDSVSKL